LSFRFDLLRARRCNVSARADFVAAHRQRMGVVRYIRR